MPVSIGDLLPGEDRRLRNRALIRWRLTASPATRMLADLQGVTCVLREAAEGLYAEVVTADGSVLARYRVAVRAGRGSVRCEYVPLRATASIPRVLARSAVLRTRSAHLNGRSSALRALSAAVRASSASLGPPIR